jgi:hypothetical protein
MKIVKRGRTITMTATRKGEFTPALLRSLGLVNTAKIMEDKEREQNQAKDQNKQGEK